MADFQVSEAEDGEKAWQMLQNNPDLCVVMSDLSMPNLDGLGLLKRLRSADDPHLRDMPVIIATGAEDDDGSKETALATGANNFITKPFDATQLLANTKLLYQQQQTHKALKETESVNDRLKAQVSIDTATDLYNRKAFLQRGEEHLAYAVRHHAELALIGIQLDKYKIIYLRRGKAFAEELLKQVANLLSEGRRREDTLARVGHADFALLLPSSDPLGTRNLAENLRKSIEQQSFTVAGETVRITASLGVACPVLRQDTHFSDLVEDAWQKVRSAEHAGGNQVKANAVTMPPAASSVTHQHVSTHLTAAQPSEVSQALAALTFKAPLKTSTEALMLAILPLLEAWNREQHGKFTKQVDSIRQALSSNSPNTSISESTKTGNHHEPA